MKRLLCVIASALCAFPGSGHAGTTPCSSTVFIEAVAYPAGASALRIAVADFNGDTQPDVATANENPRSVSVLLNGGTGGLQAPIVTDLSDFPVEIAAADLRGNSTMDVVVAASGGAYVLLGHGDGTFEAPVFYPAGITNISSMVIGTFDANSSLDIVLGSQSSSDGISLLPGNGNGTFGTPIPVASALPVRSMTSGDFDTDGTLDLATTHENVGYVSVYPGFGDGTFGPPSSFLAGASLRGIETGDFDGDTHTDLAIGSGAFVSILLGNGAGVFEAALQYPANIETGALAVGDLDQDGSLDIVAAEPDGFFGASDQVSVLIGGGDGSFAVGAAYSVGGARDLALADLNGDSSLDVATAGGSVFVLLGAVDGSLLAVPNSALFGPNNPNFASGDWNGDGSLDFAWASQNQILLVEGTKDGRFQRTGALSVGEFGPQPFGVAAGHFFEPGKADLVVSTYSDVFLFRGNGDGTFQDPVSIYNGAGLGAIDVGAFDGPELNDVVVREGCCSTLSILVLRGNGDGTFQTPALTPFAEEVLDFVPAVLVGPFTDLVVATSANVWAFLSPGDGTFLASATIPTPNLRAVAVGDFDGGGADLLVSSEAASVGLYRGNGDGTFQPPVMIALSSNGGSQALGHYNGDTFLDFAIVSGGDVLVFLGLGDSHFQSPIVLTTQIQVSFLITGDFGGNGVDDLAALGQDGIAAFRNSRLGARAEGGGAVLIGSAVVLNAEASGYGPLTHQWRKDGGPLSDGGPISGSQTATLTIDPVSFGGAGSYGVVVTDSCTSVTSTPVRLTVEFADVPFSSPFHDDIITIAAAGITGGCGGADFCPTSPVRRDQMAVFLLKAEHGAAYTPPACAEVFADVPCPGPFTDWVEQLAAEGVTGGCGGGNYCPDASVTRAQMSVLLLKTSEGSGYAPPAATGIFGDVPVGSFAADFIEDLYNRGITGGCSSSPLLYCPGNAVLRQQMATFLVRMFLTP